MANWGDLHEMPIRIEHLDVGYGEIPHGFIHKKTVPYVIITQAVEGSYVVLTPQGMQKVAEGHVFITPAEVPLEFSHLARQGEAMMRIRYVHFRFSYLGTIDLFDLYDPPTTADFEMGQIYGDIIQQMVGIKQQENGLSFTNLAKKNELAFRLLHIILQYSTPKAEYSTRLSVLQELQPLLLYIHENVHERIDIDQLLQMFPLSRSSLFSLFRSHFKLTPMDYVKTIRLREAYHKLCTTSLTLAEIADMTGFTNSFHFSREFKARYHAPPSVVRKAHQTWVMNMTQLDLKKSPTL